MEDWARKILAEQDDTGGYCEPPCEARYLHRLCRADATGMDSDQGGKRAGTQVLDW